MFSALGQEFHQTTKNDRIFKLYSVYLTDEKRSWITSKIKQSRKKLYIDITRSLFAFLFAPLGPKTIRQLVKLIVPRVFYAVLLKKIYI